MRDAGHRVGVRLRAPAGAIGDRGAGGAQRRIDQRDLDALGQPFDDDAALGALRDLDLALLEPLAGLHEDVVLAGLARTPPGAARAARRSACLPSITTRAEDAGLQPRIRLVELERHVEQPGGARAVTRTARLARPDSAPTLAVNDLAGQRVDVDGRRLALGQVAAIVLVDLGAHLHAPGFDDVGNRPAGTHLVALAILGQRHARRTSARRVAVLLDRDDAVERRLEHQAVDHLLRALHRERAPCVRFSSTTASDAWLFAARDLTSSSSCASRRRASSSESTFFCASIGGDELVAGHVELGAADVEPRRQQRDVVLRLLHRGVRLHLDDFLLGLGELGLRLLERDTAGRPDRTRSPTSSFLTGMPVCTSLTMRSVPPPTGGARG